MSALVVDHVSKTYGRGDTAVTALVEASLRVEPGELVALVGPSGSGKTTLLAIAGALLEPTSGQVLLDEQDITALPPAERVELRLERIGFVLQAANLIPFLTVRDQLLLVAKLAGVKKSAAASRADSLLKELGLADRAAHYPEKLSGGERQRVAIARALMNNPALILADEPTASLDSVRGREVVRLLAREVKAHGAAAIMVTHDERMLDLCDLVVRIVDGHLVNVDAGVAARA
ncbi:MAG TPA: ABC transporter ATP-binding protein [Ktedonobacterales bacterium]|nr:ABC transporter ATP-binding protein [Ktedonobacterales bacterium]